MEGKKQRVKQDSRGHSKATIMWEKKEEPTKVWEEKHLLGARLIRLSPENPEQWTGVKGGSSESGEK